MRVGILALLLLVLAGCQNAASPAAQAPATPKPAATPPSSAQLSNALSPLPNPSASAATSSSSAAAQGAPVSAAPKQYSAPPPMSIDPSKHYTATIDTSLGTMKADLFA